ncbi:hypothetical protein ACP4OV_011725 [Aristida adscensionis]
MGSICGMGGSMSDEEDKFATLVAKAAAKGARKAVTDAIDNAQKQKNKQLSTDEPLVAGVLPLSLAESAAATGAESGISEMARDLKLLKRLVLVCNLKKLKVTAASAASAGVKAAVVMADRTDVKQHPVGFNREIVIAAAATGASVGCFLSLKTGPTLAPSLCVMGSIFGMGGSTSDEEDNFTTLVAEAAANGARKAVTDAINKAQQQQNKQLSTDEPLVAGVLPLSPAQAAAATGAESGISEMARELKLLKRLLLVCNLKKLKVAAASAASAAVKAAVLMANQTDVEQHSVGFNREIVIAAAATGAWVGCFLSGPTPAPCTSRYTALLGPMLGGSLPTSVALYNLVNTATSTDFDKLCVFGGFTLGIFVVVSGLVAGLLGNTPETACYTRIATITAMGIVLVYFTVVLCTMLESISYMAACGLFGALLILILLIMSVQFGR